MLKRFYAIKQFGSLYFAIEALKPSQWRIYMQIVMVVVHA